MRALVIALLGLAQVALVGMASLEPPPSPAGHQHHVTAESVACHAYHDHRCVVCRTLSGDVVGAAPIATTVVLSPVIAATLPPRHALRASDTATSPLHARAPPHA